MKNLFIVLFAVFFSLNTFSQTGTVSEVKPVKLTKKQMKEAKAKEAVVVAPISAEPSIFVETEVVDYGVIEKNSDPIRTFKVTNKGAKPLLLTNCSGSCGCTVPTCPRDPILPGKTAEIQVRYATDRVGPINKTISILSNDPANPSKTVTVKGEVKAG